MKTAEGAVEYTAPQIAGGDEPFSSEIRPRLKGRSEALEDLAVEMLARGLSVRDIEDAFRNDDGSLLLSRTAVSEIGERLWQDYQEFAVRDLGGYDIAYLFVVNAIRFMLGTGCRRRAVATARPAQAIETCFPRSERQRCLFSAVHLGPELFPRVDPRGCSV